MFGKNSNLSFEVMPLPSLDAQIEFLPKRATVGITCSIKRGIEATIEYAQKLSRLGYKVEPHINARLVRDSKHLQTICDELKSIGVEDILIIAGDAKEAVGKYSSTEDLLKELVNLKISFPKIGVVGYPEGHPFINHDTTTLNMLLRQSLAIELNTKMYILSQMCGEAKIIINWIRNMRQKGVELSAIIGLPAPLENRRISQIAERIGDLASFKPAKTTPSTLFPLDRLLDEVLNELAPDNLGVDEFQIFTFNEVEISTKWAQINS